MSFFDRCCSYSLNNSSKSVKYKLHWLFISFWSAYVTSRSLPSAILLSDKFSSPQTLLVETGQLGHNLLTRILSCWSWQVLGSWKLDMSKCLSSSKETFFVLKLRSLWSWCWEKIVELKIKLLKLTGKQCWRWDRFVELGIKLLVLIQIFIVEFCYNLAAIVTIRSSCILELASVLIRDTLFSEDCSRCSCFDMCHLICLLTE